MYYISAGQTSLLQVPLESRILAEYYVLNASSRFKQSRISLLIPHIYVLGRFVNFLVYLEIYSFLKGLVKFMEIGNFEDLVLF